MSITVFRNYNITSIKALLKEVGKERYECALKDIGLLNQKPISMSGFFIEYETDTHDIYLYYKYPSRVIFRIMPVLGFWNLPHEHWVRERKEL
ncbi:hypothetical protein [Maribacter dokdonensis]|uniref:Uncharacterized protein n=1 Tax=Maribacter dokdonensis TaxID=320912 RepID=A0A1H4UPZ0_9FLAO|nr:hypothetical protein [Maribacter dokdonensis]MBU2902995.1 hypothetical protein [Maribacter dokdonensis]SEC70610.1 hypothetical protein SAMN05192540_3859 [Maribacter dokdonensis]